MYWSLGCYFLVWSSMRTFSVFLTIDLKSPSCVLPLWFFLLVFKREKTCCPLLYTYHVLSVPWIKHAPLSFYRRHVFLCHSCHPVSLLLLPVPPCPQMVWMLRIMMTGCCSAACNSRGCIQRVLSSYARESPLPLQRTTLAAAAAECVSSANNAHACDCEWVQPDSSSWDERMRESQTE